ncbi:MAG: hypothetical protein F6K36_27020, partial [Symploca sp. SIO3C6]|nr:hypothetical protein [Symploca sp. SIO3C6]
MSNQNLDLNIERWNWRGGQGTEINKAISNLLDRSSLDRGNTVGGYTATRILVEKFLDDRNITNEQILEASNLTLDDFTQPDPGAITNKYPEYQEFPGHQIAVDLLSIFTGESPSEVSAKLTGLGFTGTPGIAIAYAEDPVLLLGTIIHDFNSYIDDALGDKGIQIKSFNESIYGVKDIKKSALAMYAEALFSLDNVIPDESELLDFLSLYDLNQIEEKTTLRQTVTKLGNVGSNIGTKLALFYADDDFATQLVSQTIGKTLGGWLGDAINYEVVGSSLPAKALYRRLSGNFTTTAINMASSAMSQAFNEAFDIEDPLAQIGVDVITQEFTNHVFSELAVETFGKDFSVDYLGVDPNINLNFTFDSIFGEVISTGFSSIQTFIGSQLFNWLDEAWSDVNLNNEGSAFGGIIGGFIAPGIGNFLGSVIGGWVWDIVADEDPRAFYLVKLDDETNQFVSQFSFEKDGGRINVAQQMSESAKDTLNLIAGMIGGTPQYITPYEYGHYEEQFIYASGNGGRFSFSDAETAIHAGIVAQLKAVKFEGGDLYMKRVATLPNYTPSLQQLFTDLGVAKEYSIHKDDPVLYGQMILNIEDDNARRYLLDDWQRIHKRSVELTLNTLPENDGSEFIVGTLNNDELEGGSGDDFLYGDNGNDILRGGIGNDRLQGGDGSNTLEGNDGDDILIPIVAGQRTYAGIVDGGDGDDLLIADYSTYGTFGGATRNRGISNRVAGTIHNNVVEGWSVLSYSNFERFNITGSTFDDHLQAKAGDVIDANDGTD